MSVAGDGSLSSQNGPIGQIAVVKPTDANRMTAEGSSLFRADVPTPELVIYLQASPEALKQRIKRKGVPGERAISEKYIEQVAAAYEHFFFHYSGSDLLVVNTSDIDFVNNNRDLQLLLKRLTEPVRGTQYFLPLG